VVGVGFVVNRENWREVYDAASRAKDSGVDNFRISAVFQNDGASYFEDFFVEASALCSRSKVDLEDAHFTVFNLFGDRVDDLVGGYPENPFCPFQQLCTYVGSDLNVYRCCMTAYSDFGLLGSLETSRFSDLWRSEAVKSKLLKFDARTCLRCMYNKKNDVIRYALSENPPHVEFL
jgi:hypothetical protein